MTKGEDVDAEDLLRSVGDADLGAGGAYLLAGITGRRGKGGVRGAEAEKLLRRAVEETREGGVEAWEAPGGGRASLHDEARRLLGDMLRGNETMVLGRVVEKTRITPISGAHPRLS